MEDAVTKMVLMWILRSSAIVRIIPWMSAKKSVRNITDATLYPLPMTYWWSTSWSCLTLAQRTRSLQRVAMWPLSKYILFIRFIS